MIRFSVSHFSLPNISVVLWDTTTGEQCNINSRLSDLLTLEDYSPILPAVSLECYIGKLGRGVIFGVVKKHINDKCVMFPVG